MAKKLNNPATSIYFQSAQSIETTEENNAEQTQEVKQEPIIEQPTPEKESTHEPKTVQKQKAKKKIVKTGRPLKSDERHTQFSLTINPSLLKKAKVIAEDRCGGNTSRLFCDSLKLYCTTHGIDLDSIDVGDKA